MKSVKNSLGRLHKFGFCNGWTKYLTARSGYGDHPPSLSSFFCVSPIFLLRLSHLPFASLPSFFCVSPISSHLLCSRQICTGAKSRVVRKKYIHSQSLVRHQLENQHLPKRPFLMHLRAIHHSRRMLNTAKTMAGRRVLCMLYASEAHSRKRLAQADAGNSSPKRRK